MQPETCKEFGWEPRINFKDLVRIMVDADMEAIGLTPKGAGCLILGQKFGDWALMGRVSFEFTGSRGRNCAWRLR